jgi:hypothetical protein
VTRSMSRPAKSSEAPYAQLSPGSNTSGELKRSSSFPLDPGVRACGTRATPGSWGARRRM